MSALAGNSGFADLTVRVQPRASRSEIVGRQGGALKVRVASPPVDGAANEEMVRLLAKSLGVPRSHVELLRGASGRNKVVRVHGLSPLQVEERLGL